MSTAAAFKSRFPEFGPVSDALIDLVLSETDATLGDKWLDRDRPVALKLLTAHKLSMEGEPERSKAIAEGRSVQNAQAGQVTSMKVGDVSVTYGGLDTQSSREDGYDKTPYGRRYLELMRKNFPSVLTV